MIWLALAIGAVTASASAEPGWRWLGRDTTIATPAGTKVEVLAFAGRVRVETWDRAAVRIRVSGGPDRSVMASLDAGVLRIRPTGAEGMLRPRIAIGPAQSVTAEVQVLRAGGDPPVLGIELMIPKTMALDLAAIDADLDVDGLDATLRATAVHGTLTVRGCSGSMVLETLDGAVAVRDVRGTVRVTAPNARTTVAGLQGSLEVQSVNGGIAIESAILDSANVRTYNGGIRFTGRPSGVGGLVFWTFNGDLTFRIASGTSARFQLATADGEITVQASAQPRLTDENRRGSLRLGRGEPLVRLETFHGNIIVQEGSP